MVIFVKIIHVFAFARHHRHRVRSDEVKSPLHRHARACPGHPRLSCGPSARKTWMAPGSSPGATSPAMTPKKWFNKIGTRSRWRGQIQPRRVMDNASWDYAAQWFQGLTYGFSSAHKSASAKIEHITKGLFRPEKAYRKDFRPPSLPGSTRQSIFLRRRWTRGSSPRVTGGSSSSRHALCDTNSTRSSRPTARAARIRVSRLARR
jgi:hypothetical protein